MKNYCDTNILTVFVNRHELGRVLGNKGFNKFKNSITGQKNKSKNGAIGNKGCVIDRNALLNDIGSHKPSVGAVLTSANLRNIKVKEINGIKEGKNFYNEVCGKIKRDSRFHKKFCSKGKLRQNISKNDYDDMRHFGSAIKSNSEVFLTDNLKDFEELGKFTNIKIIGGDR